ncbi:unnamed protein product [Miscanthus lutarioriparius]|uniref:Uncharacterized protein n=1 Tax=Miscanthus lutarioriparius TaxID=422564 RepID=A0A811P8M4_9POAL|nr:unnamed protein product [Miscanthus lutarioriparius]
MKAKARVPDEMEMKAIKTMGAMEEGDAIFGAGAEVNLDSQHDNMTIVVYLYFPIFCLDTGLATEFSEFNWDMA